jgi:hypothetical protein
MRFNVACLKIVAAVLAAALVSACGSDANSLAIQSFALTPNPLTLPANGDGVLRIDYKIDAGVHNGAVWIVPKDTPDDLVATSFAIHSIDCNSAACFNADVTVTCSYRIAPAFIAGCCGPAALAPPSHLRACRSSATGRSSCDSSPRLRDHGGAALARPVRQAANAQQACTPLVRVALGAWEGASHAHTLVAWATTTCKPFVVKPKS